MAAPFGRCWIAASSLAPRRRKVKRTTHCRGVSLRGSKAAATAVMAYAADDQRERGEDSDDTPARCCNEFICPLRGRSGAHQSCVTGGFGRNIVKLCCQAEPALP